MPRNLVLITYDSCRYDSVMAARAPNLMKLGVREHEAYTHGMSSKGPWVLSSSQAVHQALSKALLEERGLPSLLAIWTKLTAKSRTA